MAKLYVQNAPAILTTTASLGASGSISGSLVCDGYSVIVGGAISNAAGSLIVEQSFDEGSTWDIVTASLNLSACTSSSRKDDIIGNAVRVRLLNGGAAASLVRAHFAVRPI